MDGKGKRSTRNIRKSERNCDQFILSAFLRDFNKMARSLRSLGSLATGQDEQGRPWSGWRNNRSDCVKRTRRGDDKAIAGAVTRSQPEETQNISACFSQDLVLPDQPNRHTRDPYAVVV
jgi:hypothetical protein